MSRTILIIRGMISLDELLQILGHAGDTRLLGFGSRWNLDLFNPQMSFFSGFKRRRQYRPAPSIGQEGRGKICCQADGEMMARNLPPLFRHNFTVNILSSKIWSWKGAKIKRGASHLDVGLANCQAKNSFHPRYFHFFLLLQDERFPAFNPSRVLPLLLLMILTANLYLSACSCMLDKS